MPVAEKNETSAMTPDPRVKRSLGEDAVPARGHHRDHLPADVRRIKGWGVDLDPKNRPMSKKELPSNVKTVRGDVRDWQVPHDKVHVSNEHPDITPVFGATVPPRGLSGRMRDYAYEFGEGTNRHWMTLLMADRIDMLESMVTDTLRGKPDNLIEETGLPAYMNYGDRRRVYMWAGAAALVAVGLGFLATSRR
ncbi:MAG TPA: hypothetical protein VF057_11490 [Thermoanaerobaculia bacterium]